MGLWKKRECDIETLNEAKRRLQVNMEKYKIEKKLNRSPERHLPIIEADEEYASDDESRFDLTKRLQSEYQKPPPENEIGIHEIPDRSRVKREKSLRLPRILGRFESLDDSFPRRTPNRRVTETKLYSKMSEDMSLTEEDHIKFSANYFIHDYSSDTEQGSIKSCEGRIRISENEEYPRLAFQHKNMSEKDIKYYEGIDDEGIIGMQNAMIIDYYEENPEKHRLKNRLNFRNLVIENDFLLRIFPLAKEEKPGIDLYNYGVVLQFLVIIYILFFFSQMTGEKEELSETFKFKRFRTEMIFFMFLQIMLVLLDRYFYISNTFDSIKVEPAEGDATTKSVINNVMQEQNKYNFVKLMVYVTLVILVHVVVIWYFPITGNYKINEQIFCDANGPCNDLNDNQFLWGFYILYMAYFCVTALQFRYGLPEIRKGHFMYERVGFFYKWSFNIFFYIPFLFEVKTFIDWTFTKTAMTIWDWFTFETIYSEFYGAKLAAEKGKAHEMGTPIGWFDKILFGFVGLLLCLGLILAPLIIFSSLNPIAEMNLVKGAGIELNIELEEGKSLYNIFATTVANEVRNLTEEEFSLLNFRRYKELRVSDHTLYQRVEMLPYSDKIWSLSPPAIRKMKDHFENAMKTNHSEAAISLEYSFNRQYPPGSNKLQRFIKKKIMEIENYSEIFRSFYEALNSTECKPVFIKLDRFYPSVVHLTNDVKPEIIPIKFKTVNLKIFCTSDPLIGNNVVKYWTMYIDDDLDIARRKKKFEKEEEENNKISINLRPKANTIEDEEYIYENKETMGIYSDEPSNNQQIIQEGFKSQDSIPVHLQRSSDRAKYSGTNGLQDEDARKIIREPEIPETGIGRNLQANNTDSGVEIQDISLELEGEPTKVTEINLAQKPPTANVTLSEKLDSLIKSIFERGKNETKDTMEETVEKIHNIIEAETGEDDDMKLRNVTEDKIAILQNRTIQEALKEFNLTSDKINLPILPPYSPELKARIEDELHVGGKSSEPMGTVTKSLSEVKKDEDESAKQMGVVIYTFSDKVTPGLLDYSVITFYVSVVFVAGKILRGYLWGNTEKIYLSDLPYPDELLVI